MAKATYVGTASGAKKVKKMYVGTPSGAKKVKKGYIGVNGVAKQFFSSNFEYTWVNSSGGSDGISFSGNIETDWFIMFTKSGTLTVTSEAEAVDVCCVGGGGGGSAGYYIANWIGEYISEQYATGGAGGGGGYVKDTKTSYPNGVTLSEDSYSITVGEGGTAGAFQYAKASSGGPGGTSEFGSILSAPGGSGGYTSTDIWETSHSYGGAGQGKGGDGESRDSGRVREQPGGTGARAFDDTTVSNDYFGGGGGGGRTWYDSTGAEGDTAGAYGHGGRGGYHPLVAATQSGTAGVQGVVIIRNHR